ncbi:MAG: E2/UBC family protein [Thermoplasmata archaeon]
MIPDELIKDLSCLKDRDFNFEIKEEGPRVYIWIRDFPLPDGKYNSNRTDVLVFTTQYYPNAGFDMFWVDDSLKLANGQEPKNGNQFELHLGRRWRRYSIHPFNSKPWNPGSDSICSYISYIEQRLNKAD